MIAAHTSRRDPIGAALFYRLDWCEARPGLMLACIGAMFVLAGVLEGVMP